MKKQKAKYVCEKCGKPITLEEYLEVDISKLAKCKDCKKII